MTAKGIPPSNQAGTGPPSSSLPGARLALVLLLSINLFNYIDRYVLAAVEPNIREELLGEKDAKDESPMGKMGLLSLAFIVTYMIVAPLFGWLANRTSRWLLVGIGVILWSLASGASGIQWPVPLAHAYWILLLTRCFVGIGEGAYGPVAPTVIADLYPEKIRGRVLSWFYMAIPVGSALGFALGGQMAKIPALGWRWAFYLVVPPGILLGLLCFFLREPPRGQADQVVVSARRKFQRSDYLVLARTPSFVLNTLGMAAMTFAVAGMGYWMAAFLKYHNAQAIGGIEPVTLFGILTALAGLLATLSGGILGDHLRPRFPGSYFLVSGVGMIVGFPMVLLVLYTPFPLAWVFVFLAEFCLFFNTGPTNAILANVTHPSIRATGFALNIFIIHALGDAISPALIGFIADRSSLKVGFLVISGMTLIGGLLWLWGARYLAEDTARAPSSLERIESLAPKTE